MSAKPSPTVRPTKLLRPVDMERDHMIGAETANFTLVEYGSYACSSCHAAHGVVKKLRERFGDRLRYVFRHLPLADRALASRSLAHGPYIYLGSADHHPMTKHVTGIG